MSAPAVTQSRVCPECGTVNNGHSLFCAECGANLGSASYDSGAQTTTAFSPVAQPTRHDTGAYAPVQSDPRIPIPDDRDYVANPVRQSARESIRGFWLGFIASILIVLVVGFYVWSTVISDSTRDRFLNLFS